VSLFQPFDPGDDKARGRRLVQPVPLRSVLPSLVTLLALCAGLTSMRMSIEHHYQTAIVFIGVAALLDILALVGYGLALHWFVARHGLRLSVLRAGVLAIGINVGTAALLVGLPRLLAWATGTPLQAL